MRLREVWKVVIYHLASGGWAEEEPDHGARERPCPPRVHRRRGNCPAAPDPSLGWCRAAADTHRRLEPGELPMRANWRTSTASSSGVAVSAEATQDRPHRQGTGDRHRAEVRSAAFLASALQAKAAAIIEEAGDLVGFLAAVGNDLPAEELAAGNGCAA